MSRYEYKVIPAPNRAVKAKGVKGTEARFANALQGVMNEQAADGWEYQRTDTLPCEERQGLRGRTTVYQNLLVFRRAVPDAMPVDVAVQPAVESVFELPKSERVERAVVPETVSIEADSGAHVARLGPAVRRHETAIEAD